MVIVMSTDVGFNLLLVSVTILTVVQLSDGNGQQWISRCHPCCTVLVRWVQICHQSTCIDELWVLGCVEWCPSWYMQRLPRSAVPTFVWSLLLVIEFMLCTKGRKVVFAQCGRYYLLLLYLGILYVGCAVWHCTVGSVVYIYLAVVVLEISLSKYWISLMAQLRAVDSKLIRQPIGMVMHGHAFESSESFS